MSGANRYVKVAINVPTHLLFDYLPPLDTTADQLPVGTRVQVPFAKRPQTTGMILGHCRSSRGRELKRVTRLLDDGPILTAAHLHLLRWASRYYHYPIGQSVFGTLPPILRRGRARQQSTIASQPKVQVRVNGDDIHLSEEQQKALTAILHPRQKWHPFLLHGVAGSGKTAIYLRVIEQALKNNRQTLVLLPEISLTPQTLARFQNYFSGNIVLMHSSLSDRQRLNNWLQAQSGAADIVIGARSAVWTPLARPGAYIVDEEHDPSYKQQTGFLYSARDVALLRAKREAATIVLGSATPSLEALHRTLDGRQQMLTLSRQVPASGNRANRQLIDLRSQNMHGALSSRLLTAMQKELDDGNQVLLFRNRRGYATHLLCHGCGDKVNCPRCERPYTWHKSRARLICHHCDKREKRPVRCASCHGDTILEIGHGTERIEETLATLFPKYRIIRLDRDSARKKQRLEELLEEIVTGRARIIVGTQMLAKGHHFPAITLSAIVDADAGLFSSDYRASERLVQLLFQVAGRSGRGKKVGQVWIQTYAPEHPLLQALVRSNYQTIADKLLSERRQIQLPPYSFHALLRAHAKEHAALECFMDEARSVFPETQKHVVSLFGPISAPIEKRAGWYRMQLLAQSLRRDHLHKALGLWLTALDKAKSRARVRWSIDVDPQDMM